MKKKLIAALALFGGLYAHADTILTVEYLDGSEAKEQLSKLSKVEFASSGAIKLDYLSGSSKDYGTVSNTQKIVFVEGDYSSAETVANATQLKVFPNPTSETITIVGAEPGQTVSIYSAKGQQVLRSNESTISVANLTNGQYLVVVGQSVIKLIKK